MIAALIFFYLLGSSIGMIWMGGMNAESALRTATVAIFWLPLLLLYTSKEAYGMAKQIILPAKRNCECQSTGGRHEHNHL